MTYMPDGSEICGPEEQTLYSNDPFVHVGMHHPRSVVQSHFHNAMNNVRFASVMGHPFTHADNIKETSPFSHTSQNLLYYVQAQAHYQQMQRNVEMSEHFRKQGIDKQGRITIPTSRIKHHPYRIHTQDNIKSTHPERKARVSYSIENILGLHEPKQNDKEGGRGELLLVLTV